MISTIYSFLPHGAEWSKRGRCVPLDGIIKRGYILVSPMVQKEGTKAYFEQT